MWLIGCQTSPSDNQISNDNRDVNKQSTQIHYLTIMSASWPQKKIIDRLMNNINKYEMEEYIAKQVNLLTQIIIVYLGIFPLISPTDVSKSVDTDYYRLFGHFPFDLTN